MSTSTSRKVNGNGGGRGLSKEQFSK